MKIKTSIDFNNKKWTDGFLWGLSTGAILLIIFKLLGF